MYNNHLVANPGVLVATNALHLTTEPTAWFLILFCTNFATALSILDFASFLRPKFQTARIHHFTAPIAPHTPAPITAPGAAPTPAPTAPTPPPATAP